MKYFKSKRLFSMLLAFILVFSLAACTSKSSDSNASQETTNSTQNETSDENLQSTPEKSEADPFGKYEPSIEVTAVRPIPDGLKFKEGESIENNVWTREYENTLGIKIKYVWTTPEAQYEQKLNISIASGDLPDIFRVNSLQLKQLVEDGQLEDLTELYEQYAAPFTKQVLSGDGGNALKSCRFDGKLMALPKMGSAFDQTHVLWVRTDWLKKLDLPEPKTMDDVFKISEAFTKQDPDGNNKADTFGLGVNKDLWGFYAALEGFFNGFHAYPNIWIEDGSGNLVYGSIQPEMKDALLKLQEMFKDGQIDKEFGVKDSFKVNENANAGKLGMFYGFFWNVGLLSDGKTKNPEMEWMPFAIPSIDSEPAKVQVPFAISTYYVVRKGAANPEAAIKMYNLLLEKSFGETAEPEKYNVDKEGTPIFEYPLIYGEPPRKNLDAHLRVVEALDTNDTSKLNAEEKGYYDNIMAFKSGDISFWKDDRMYGVGGSLSVIDGYSKKGLFYDNRYFGAPTQTMSEKNSTLAQIQLQTFTEIIMGGSIDKFDKYVEDWKKLGGEQITKEVNKWYAAQK